MQPIWVSRTDTHGERLPRQAPGPPRPLPLWRRRSLPGPDNVSDLDDAVLIVEFVRSTTVCREGYMEIITVRDLRLRRGDIWRRLKDRKPRVLTSNGRPVALMIGVDDNEDIEATLRALRHAYSNPSLASSALWWRGSSQRDSNRR